MKSDSTFLLEHAAWPAFVMETSGTIRHANQAAIALFGPKLDGESVSLAALWDESDETLEQFLARLDRTALPIVRMRFMVRGGAVAWYATHISPVRDTQRRYLVQLIAEHPLPPTGLEGIGGAMPLGVGAAPSAPLAPLTPAGPGPGSDTLFIHKQKLDCALHLARTVSLDFNNALAGIMAHSSLLLGVAERDHPWRPVLVEIEKAAHRGAEITHQLALFGRPEKDGGIRPAANLNAVLRRVVENLGQNRPDTIVWSLQLDPQLYSAKFDEPKLQQAFARIIENSLEATAERGAIGISSSNLEVTVPLHDESVELPPGSYVRVEISDDGPGIPPQLLPRIFEPFFTTKDGHRGLGLAWVYGIVTNHRGLVAVSSQPGRGTSTRIYLPATRQRLADTGGRLEDLRGEETILLVDDEELILAMGQVVLGGFGYRVLTASSGAQAFEVLEKSAWPIDLVVTDLVMPQMSGHEFAEQMQLRLPGVPLLYISGLVRGEGTEGESFLHKPFSSQELLTRVRQLLAARRVQEA